MKRTKRLFLRLSSVAAIFATAAAASCAGDDVIELDVFDGGYDASTTLYDATLDAPADAPVIDAAVVDAADSSTPIDSGSDSGLRVVLDSGSATDAGADSAADASDDSGSQDDAGDGGDGGLDGGQTVTVLNGCISYEDDTDPAATRVIQGPPSSAPVQFTPNCMMIRAGQSVTFQQADFSNHPLIPGNGTTPSPITLTNSGTTVTFTFPNAGTYGFECELHPSMMFGAIDVTP